MDVYIVLKSEPYSFEIFSDFDTAKTVFLNHLLTEWKSDAIKRDFLSKKLLSLYEQIIRRLFQG